MANAKVAVVGGTKFDSSKGASFLKERGIKAQAFGLSENPDEQTALYAYPEKVIERFEKVVKPSQFTHLVFYCNSLSFITNWPVLYPNKVWDLTSMYAEVLANAEQKYMAIWVAESSMKLNLTKLLKEQGLYQNIGVQIMPKLNLVKQLEESSLQQQQTLISIELQKLQKDGYKEVVFGCTHFDHPAFYDYPAMKIYQPGLALLDKFSANYSGAM